MNTQKALILISVIAFVLAFFNVVLPYNQLIAFGLAFFAAAHLV